MTLSAALLVAFLLLALAESFRAGQHIAHLMATAPSATRKH
ncbi:hypothetical protein [Streptomyces coelicoflavus]